MILTELNFDDNIAARWNPDNVLTFSAILPDVVGISYDDKSKAVSTSPRCTVLNSAKTKMYTVDYIGYIYQRALSTAGDISSAGDVEKTLDIRTLTTSASGIDIYNDSKMLITDVTGKRIIEFSIPDITDISTATTTGQTTISLTGLENTPMGVRYANGGLSVWLYGYDSDLFHKWALSTAGVLTGNTYIGASSTFSAIDATGRGFDISDDERTILLCGDGNNNIYLLYMYIAGDITTLKYSNNFYNVEEDTTIEDITWIDNKLYICGNTNNRIYQYTIPDFTSNNYVYQFTDISGNNKNAIINRGLVTIETIDSNSFWNLGENGAFFTINVNAKAGMFIVRNVNGNSSSDTETPLIADASLVQNIYLKHNVGFTAGIGGSDSLKGDISINGYQLHPGANTGRSIAYDDIDGYNPFPKHDSNDLFYWQHSFWNNTTLLPFTRLLGRGNVTSAKGYFGEIILFEEPCFKTDIRQKHEGYLNSIYNFGPPSTHPYYLEAPKSYRTPKNYYYYCDLQDPIDGTNDTLDGYDCTPDEIYAKFDEFITLYPNNVTKTNLGKDQSGSYDIFSYTFTPTNPLHKIIIEAGIHWEPAITPPLIYNFIKDIYSSTYEVQKWLKDNFTIIIVPCLNPWGHANKNRNNSRNINLNRNFDTDEFEAGGENGDVPESEAETVIMKTLINNNLDTDYYFAFHCVPLTGAGNHLVFASSENPSHQYAVYNTANYMNSLPYNQGEDHNLEPAVLSTSVYYAYSVKNINAMLIENTVLSTAEFVKNSYYTTRQQLIIGNLINSVLRVSI